MQQALKWSRLGDRLNHFKQSVLPQASQNVQAAVRACQNRVTDFATLMRARVMELQAKMQALKLADERATAKVNLLYLAGEEA